MEAPKEKVGRVEAPQSQISQAESLVMTPVEEACCHSNPQKIISNSGSISQIKSI
jgi:hypothetical protein